MACGACNAYSGRCAWSFRHICVASCWLAASLGGGTSLTGDRMRFGILGPVLVNDGAVAVAVPAVRQRVLLAALLVHAGQAVSADALAEVVWDGSPPPAAAGTLRTHVMRLRRVLGPRAGKRLVTRYPGYLVEADEDEVDLLRFSRLCRDGSAAVGAGSWQQASQVLAEALGLWRGRALADVPSQLLQRNEVPRIDQLRLQAQEWRIDADLHLGRHAELVPELQSLAAEHPLRERFHAHLLLALYRSGRQADALAAYRDARQVLVGELGIEPGPELKQLHQQILDADPALADTAPAASAVGEAAPARRAPRQLPAAVAGFTGRAAELEALTKILRSAEVGTRGTVVISAIGGTAGVGKTALAVHWAHQAAEVFPDGQLYVNLRGYDPGRPMSATDALAGFLRSLGVPGQDIPAEEAERAARYRSLLADQQMLIVLDNASSAEQVRPLLPGTPACTVLVTSRDALAGLVARDGAHRLDLDLLPLQDAISLLRELTGARADTSTGAIAALAQLCCRLPLALRVAAELIAARPSVPLGELVGELTDQQRRLDRLDAGGDSRTAIRAVFSWSYRYLDADAARAFRLAGLHPGSDFDPYAVAALTGSELQQARRMLDKLARAHLIQPGGPGRHGMHDLLRAYARELADARDTELERRAALTGLFDHYLHTAATAMDTLYPAERHRRPSIHPPTTASPPVTDPAEARLWLDAELANLVTAAGHATDSGWPGHAIRLALTLFRYLDAGGLYPEAVTIHTCACRAASDTGDRAGEADAHNGLGAVDLRQGRYQQAADHFQQSLALFRQTGDRIGQARALGNLGNARFQQGCYDQATSLHEQALGLYRAAGDRIGETITLGNLGGVEQQQGRYEKAAHHHEQSLALARATGNSNSESYALLNLGIVSSLRGRYPNAISQLHQALILFRETGQRRGEAAALTRIGDVHLRQGRSEQASHHHQQCLALCREIGDRSGEAEALNGLGEVLLLTSQPDDARTRHATALDLASQIGDRYQQARAHNGLGHAHHATGDLDQAWRHWQEALALYVELGVPEADQVRAQLKAAHDDDHSEPLDPPGLP